MDVKTITNDEVTETNCKGRCRKDQKFSSDAYHVGKNMKDRNSNTFIEDD